ncbi:MAG: sigma-70 family RNA polymerase sigma factor [Bacteroidetes bacterium]|nr:MAG: sigma-70 family RNA polymerase sigma factor [Bacteroidota bacterium]
MNPQTKYSETELVALLQQRDDRAFSYLYNNYAGALNGVILPIVNDEETANDVLQEVFVNVWKKIEFYDASKGRLFTWLLNIARNAAIDKVRSKSFRNSKSTVSIPESGEANVSASVSQPNADFIGLKKMLGKLKDEYRLLIDLSYFQGFSHDEISKALNIPLGTVKTRIRTALIQLKTML